MGEQRSPIQVALLTMVTCGIYGFIWKSSICDEVNQGLGREEFNFGKELLFIILTCGAWQLYFKWRLCEAVVELQEKYGAEPEMDMTMLFLTNLVIGVGPFFLQKSLNNAWEHGGR